VTLQPDDLSPTATVGLDALYARWVRAADWAQAHRAVVWAAGAPLVVLALVAIN